MTENDDCVQKEFLPLHGCTESVLILAVFTVRLCEAYTHGIAVDVCLSVCPSVRPSVKRVYCDKTKASSEKKFNYN